MTPTAPSPVELDGWDAMIRDAKKKIIELEYSIKVFERRKAAGEPCPLPDESKLTP